MISLKNTATDLDRLEELQRTAVDCYGLAIQSAAQYAIEIEREPTAQFREHLETLERQWRAATDTGEMLSVQSSFRGELREYRDITQERLRRLRADVEAAAAAMTLLAGNVGASAEDHEIELKRELRSLEATLISSDLLAMRDVVRAAIKGISSSCDHMRRSAQVVVAQLQDEIRLLHVQIQAERRAMLTDRASGVWNRQKIDSRIDELIRQDYAFSMVAVAIANLKGLGRLHSRTVVEGALKALLKRFAGLTEEQTMIGRWNETQFVAILDDVPNAGAMSGEISRKLSGIYPIQENGIAKIVKIQVRVGAIERQIGEDQEAFQEKLRQLSATLDVT